MKKLKFLPFILLLCLTLSFSLAPVSLALEDPQPASRAAAVIDMNSGQVFYSLNEQQRVYPASLTKVMTVLLAIEAIESQQVSIYDTVTASANMNFDLVADGSSAGIMVGETMTLEHLLYCAMLSSGNDACNVIAEYIGGSISQFVERMNQRAAELGCLYTHFTNTHGLPNTEHYTTVEDFARIALEAANHQLFMEICDTAEITLPATNLAGERHLKNSNALICDKGMYGSKYLYEPAAGMKTGFTSDAGYCLVSTAANSEVELMALVFGGYSYVDDRGRNSYTNFEDSILLYDWVFNNFSYQEILKSTEFIASVPVSMGANADSVSLRPSTSLMALLPNDTDLASFEKSITLTAAEDGEALSAPISAGEVLGTVSVSRQGVNYGTVKLIASSSVDLSRTQYMKAEIMATLQSRPVVITGWALLALVALYLILVIRYRVVHTRRRKAIQAAKLEQARKAAAQKQRMEAQAKAQARAQAQRAAVPSKSPVSSATTVIPTQRSAPAINYFTDSDKGSVSHTQAPPDTEESRKAKAERDYFEEFFKQK